MDIYFDKAAKEAHDLECVYCGKDNALRHVFQKPALRITPKQHKRRRNQTAAYHARIQKKWDKRAKTDADFQDRQVVAIQIGSDLHKKLQDLCNAKR